MLNSIKSLIKHAAIRHILRGDARTARELGINSRGRISPREFGCSVSDDGLLNFSGISVRELVREYGTPLHVLNENVLISTREQFVADMRTSYPNVVLATSYKTNPVPYVLRKLHAAGSLAEVISHFELWLAIRLGVGPEHIILNGPGKGNDSIKLAVEKRISMINIDNLGEIEKVAKYARHEGVIQRVGLRVTTSVGWSSQFGLSIADGAAESAFRELLKYPELNGCGLHLHLGTGIKSVETYQTAVAEVVEFSRLLNDRYGTDITEFDLGGGFGVPSVRSMTDWDVRMSSLGYQPRLAIPEISPKVSDYAQALEPLFDRIRGTSSDSDELPRIVFEPGRAITSRSQSLLLTVIGKKHLRDGRELLYVDGGKNISMPLGWEVHQIYPATAMNAQTIQTYDVFGPLCHPGDIICRNLKLPELNEGDVLAIMDAGAYFIPNQMNFSNPRPGIVAIGDQGHRMVRKAEIFDDIIRLDDLDDIQ